MASIRVSGPEGRKTYKLDQGSVSIGRDPSNGLVLNDGGLSRRHCVFERDGDRWQVRDLGSRNGVLVNGSRVAAQILNSGDVIRIGSHSIRFEDAAAPVPRSEPASVQDAQVGLAGAEQAGSLADATDGPNAESGQHAAVDSSTENERSDGGDGESTEHRAPGGLFGRMGASGIIAMVLYPLLAVYWMIRDGVAHWGVMEWVVKVPLTILSIPLFCIVAYAIWPAFRVIHAWFTDMQYGGVVAVVGTEKAVQRYQTNRWIWINCGHFILAGGVSTIIASLPVTLVDRYFFKGARDAARAQKSAEAAQVARETAERDRLEHQERMKRAEEEEEQAKMLAAAQKREEQKRQGQLEQEKWLGSLPGIAVRNASNPDASSWVEFADWYYTARFCGGIVFPDAKASGEAMYQVVDRSTPRGESLAQARRQVAEAEWTLMHEIRQAFPDADSKQFLVIGNIIFGGTLPTSVQYYGNQGIHEPALLHTWDGRFGGKRMYFKEIEDVSRLEERSDGAIRTNYSRSHDVFGWKLIRTTEGVRIDPYSGSGIDRSSEFNTGARDPKTGSLLPGVNTSGADVAAVLQSCEPWLQVLRDARSLIESGKSGGGVSQFIFLLRDELQPRILRIADDEAMERGWLFTLPPLDAGVGEQKKVTAAEGWSTGDNRSRVDPATRRGELQQLRTETEEILKTLPSLRIPTASDLDASSWREFADWYQRLRSRGGMLCPSAQVAGQAAFDIVDRSSGRGKTLAEARRRVAEAEWELMQFIWDSFQTATVEELSEVGAFIFGGANLRSGLGAIGEQSYGELRMIYMIRNTDDGSTWGLVRTDEGVRIDAFGLSAGESTSDEYRDESTGKLAAWVNKDAGNTARAMKGVEPWLETLRAVRKVVESGRCKGRIGALREILELELGARIDRAPDAGVLERGWTFSMPPLEKPQPSKGRSRS